MIRGGGWSEKKWGLDGVWMFFVCVLGGVERGRVSKKIGLKVESKKVGGTVVLR